MREATAAVEQKGCGPAGEPGVVDGGSHCQKMAYVGNALRDGRKRTQRAARAVGGWTRKRHQGRLRGLIRFAFLQPLGARYRR